MLVVPTMAAVAVYVPVTPGAPALPDPVLATTVSMPVLTALTVSSGRAAPASTTAPMAAAAFAVAVAPTAPVLPAPAPATPVAHPVASTAPVAILATAVGPPSSDTMV